VAGLFLTKDCGKYILYSMDLGEIPFYPREGKRKREREFLMGKVIEPVKLTSLFNPHKSVVVEAVVDTGATMMVLPRDIVSDLGLEKVEEVRVRYANNQVDTKEIYGVVRLEIQGRVGNFDVLAENEGVQPLVGQIVLERLDLVVDPSARKVVPNPRSPEMPMVEIL